MTEKSGDVIFKFFARLISSPYAIMPKISLASLETPPPKILRNQRLRPKKSRSTATRPWSPVTCSSNPIIDKACADPDKKLQEMKPEKENMYETRMENKKENSLIAYKVCCNNTNTLFEEKSFALVKYTNRKYNIH
uniref:Uncharacterized protein n=1 Tax=Romanomermis culicivorax TaxID=13658 RepID=A0A915L3A3_ROMCU